MRSVVALSCFFACILASSCKRTQEESRVSAPSQPEPAKVGTITPKEFNLVATGNPYGLHLADGVLDFCDSRGGRELNLKTGQETNKDRSCASKEEPNTACSGVGTDVEVRAPLSEPNDIVDVGGSSFPLNGRVHDCAGDAKFLAIVTTSTTVVIDTAKSAITQVSSQGGDRVAIGDGWVAWSAGSDLHAKPVK